jgi:hypothetical protein
MPVDRPTGDAGGLPDLSHTDGVESAPVEQRLGSVEYLLVTRHTAMLRHHIVEQRSVKRQTSRKRLTLVETNRAACSTPTARKDCYDQG